MTRGETREDARRDGWLVKEGPVRESPSAFQRWLYRMEPRYSTAMFVGLTFATVVAAASFRAGAEGSASPVLLLGGSLVLYVLVAAFFHSLRPDRRYTTEERLEQVVRYWPPLRVPVLRDGKDLAVTLAGVAAALTMLRASVGGATDGSTQPGAVVGVLLFGAALAVLVVMVCRYVRQHRT